MAPVIYVVAESIAQVNTWREEVGLPRSHVTAITTEHAIRGRSLKSHETVRLPIPVTSRRVSLASALAAAGVPFDLLPVVG